MTWHHLMTETGAGTTLTLVLAFIVAAWIAWRFPTR